MSKTVTMDEIAQELNVSKSHVSRESRERYGVNDETGNLIKLMH